LPVEIVADREDYEAGARPVGIIAGDWDGDTSPDLVVSNFVGDDINMLYAQAGGGLGGAGITRTHPSGATGAGRASRIDAANHVDLDYSAAAYAMSTNEIAAGALITARIRRATTIGFHIPGNSLLASAPAAGSRRLQSVRSPDHVRSVLARTGEIRELGRGRAGLLRPSLSRDWTPAETAS